MVVNMSRSTNEARDTKAGASPPRSEISSASSTPFRRRRFGGQTRREALERRLMQHRHHIHAASSFRSSCNDDEKKDDEYTQNDDRPNNLHNMDSEMQQQEQQQQQPPLSPSSRMTPVPNVSEGTNEEAVYLTPPRKTNLQKHLDVSKGENTVEDTTAVTEDITEGTLVKPEVSAGYTALTDTYSPARTSLSGTKSSASAKVFSPRRRPLREEMTYYRVVYRGVVALLSSADSKAPRSGSYLGYGEIFGSSQEIVLEDDCSIGPTLTARSEDHGSFSAIDSFLDSPPRSIFSQGAGSVSSIGTQQTKSTIVALSPQRNLKSIPQPCPERSNSAIRVEDIITGGYAKDALDNETPKKSNIDDFSLSHRKPDPGSLGYLFARQKSRSIIERLTGPPPRVEEGAFRYRIVSTTPLAILTGPAWDAPRTKAMVLPGTMLEVSLRLSFSDDSKISEELDSRDEVWFLRMSHRRGWIATHRQGRPQVVAKEIGSDASDMCSIVSGRSVMTDDAQSVLSSVAVSSVATPSAVARRRHRPPRRRREVEVTRTLDSSRNATPTKNNGSRNYQEPHLYTPSSNVSLLSDDSSLDRRHQSLQPDSPDVSYSTQRSSSSITTAPSNHFLFRVTAPKGLLILDAPHYQVNNLIRGKPPANPVVEPQPKGHSILKTMPGRTATGSSSHAGIAQLSGTDAASRKRVIPRGALFEASKRMESAGAFSQGSGLIKLADNSGWAIVPHREELERQYKNLQGDISSVKEGEASRAVEEVGNSCVDGSSDRPTTLWFRVHARSGTTVQCAPHISTTSDDDDSSPSSSRSTSVASGSNHGSNPGVIASQESDVTSSVASTFVDAMLFRTPKKREGEQSITRQQDQIRKRPEKPLNLNIPCGMCVEVERWVDLSMDQSAAEFVRLAGGQGWLPMYKGSKYLMSQVVRPEFRFGSFWFRVQAGRGIKVRLGPSVRAPSIKSDDDIHFRFECGEFLRASEIMTVFSDAGHPIESYAKLYRNRHVRLNSSQDEHRQLQSLTSQSEWVQIYDDKELFLEECAASGPPRIERHKQGWRYSVIPEEGLPVRKGPSFASETTGTRLFGGETVLINERVTPAGDKITWLRMKDGEGWLHDVDDTGKQVVIPHSLRHRARTAAKVNRGTEPHEEVAYNTIIARLFHNEPDGIRRLPRAPGSTTGSATSSAIRRSSQL